MIVCIDSGNSRIKWGVHDGSTWLAQGAVAQGDFASLGALVPTWQKPTRVCIANVAGQAALINIRQALAPLGDIVLEAVSAREACGVKNHYHQPERLGVDRWCALIGAWHSVQAPTIVVMAGTATTIDTLDGGGNFLGGMILPGVGLMLGALSKGAADLPLAAGHHAAYPRCTDDAIVSGVLEAQIGAIERAWHRLNDVGAICLISGGYAEQLLPHLAVPYRLAQNLPLEGLERIARMGRKT